MNELSYRPDRLPDMELVGYLERWCLIPRKRQGNIYLHHFLGPDEPVMHDHPWDFKSIILSGGYIEALPTDPSMDGEGTLGRITGEVIQHKAEDLHYIKEVLPNTWTLIITGAVRREWGFFNGEWIHHDDFKGREIEYITRNGYSND